MPRKKISDSQKGRLSDKNKRPTVRAKITVTKGEAPPEDQGDIDIESGGFIAYLDFTAADSERKARKEHFTSDIAALEKEVQNTGAKLRKLLKGKKPQKQYASIPKDSGCYEVAYIVFQRPEANILQLQLARGISNQVQLHVVVFYELKLPDFNSLPSFANSGLTISQAMSDEFLRKVAIPLVRVVWGLSDEAAKNISDLGGISNLIPDDNLEVPEALLVTLEEMEQFLPAWQDVEQKVKSLL